MNSVVITNCIPELIALLGLASTDETRYVIMCVRFEVSAQRTLAIATDGRRMGILDCGASLPAADAPFAVHVPAAELAALLKAAHLLRPKTVAVRVSAEHVRAEFDGGIVSLAASAITYPDLRKALSTHCPRSECTSFNPDLSDGFTDCDAEGLVATVSGEGSPIYIHGTSGRFFGLLMPINPDSACIARKRPVHAIPAWIGGVA